MKNVGLALSGGGFRATLYHLGLVRFLRDAGLLGNVSHITAVSGGSIFAAHLSLNWGRYSGSPSEFDAAAAELLEFVRIDVRNRILRRYGLGYLVRGPRRLLGLSNRRLTRTGLLEYFYEKGLYGDTSLFQLSESPEVHLLATNLSEGRLCSFCRDGLWMICREGGQSFRIDRTHIGLATVAMAVAASSAFPGFFPPMVLSGADVGANSGEFGRQAYTDGGVYDNLGVRMFRFLALSSGKDRLWDGVLVSDVGKPFEIQSSMRAGGFIRTAMRATDIVMDRVWQLENDTFKDTPGFAFARITDVIEPSQDPTALHPEIQRQLSGVRTDLDRFSAVEISSLIRHGYCVGRQACRSRPDVFGTDLPNNPPWDPLTNAHAKPVAVAAPSDSRPRGEPTAVTAEARALHDSAIRRIWTTLLDCRDWVSYVYVPILVPIFFLLPYFVAKHFERSHRINKIVESLAQESRDLEVMTRLIDGPVTSIDGENAEELSPENQPNQAGFVILQDLRIIDLRRWKLPTENKRESTSVVYGYRRLKVRKDPNNMGNNNFRISVLAYSPGTQVHFPPQQMKPKLYSRRIDGSAPGEKLVHWEVGVDFRRVPAGEFIDIIYEHMSPGVFLREGIDSTTMAFQVEAETIELNRWLLMPQGMEYRNFKTICYPTGKPEASESVRVISEFLADDYTILAFKLLALKAGFTYELTWSYR
jgi:predicted acylesterase/phospholipase RssA